MPAIPSRTALPSTTVKQADFLSLQQRMSKDLFVFDAQKRRDDDVDALSSLISPEPLEAGGITGTTGYEGMLGVGDTEDTSQAPDAATGLSEAPARRTTLLQGPAPVSLPQISADEPVYDPTQTTDISGPPDYDPSEDTGTVISGPTGVVPSSGAAPAPSGGPPARGSDEIEAYIRHSAAKRHIDPEIAVRVAKIGEGGVDDPVRQSDVVYRGRREESYGPFQLNVEGGVGSAALRAGIDPRNPSQWREAIDFALDEAARSGWGQWHGAARIGIGERQGIGTYTGPVPEAPNPVASAAPSPTQRAAESRAQTGETRLQGITPPQFGLGDPDAESICGPILTMAFAQSTGRSPTIAEAKQMAAQHGGWTRAQGMGGPEATANTLRQMGIPATYKPGALDVETIRSETASGNPVGINTRDHYFVVEGVDADGRLDLGNSAKALKASGGRQWFRPDEIVSLGMGAPTGAIYKDSPASPTPSVAVKATGMPPASATPPDPTARREADALALTADLPSADSPPSAPAGGPTPAGAALSYRQPLSAQPELPPGTEPGTTTPIINPDGSVTTERSITVTEPSLNGGRPTNIPTVWGGRVVSDDEAVDNAINSGRPWPSYETILDAERAAQQRSDDLGAGRATSVGGALMPKGPLDAGVPVRDRWADEQPPPYDPDQGAREATPGSVGAQPIISPMAPPESPGVSVTAAQPSPPNIQISQGGPPTPAAQWTPVETVPTPQPQQLPVWDSNGQVIGYRQADEPTYGPQKPVNPFQPGTLRPGDIPGTGGPLPEGRIDVPGRALPQGGITVPQDVLDQTVPRAAQAVNPPDAPRYPTLLDPSLRAGQERAPFQDEQMATPPLPTLPGASGRTLTEATQAALRSPSQSISPISIYAALQEVPFDVYAALRRKLISDAEAKRMAGTDPLAPFRGLGIDLPSVEALNPEGRPASDVFAGLLLAGALPDPADPAVALAFRGAGRAIGLGARGVQAAGRAIAPVAEAGARAAGRTARDLAEEGARRLAPGAERAADAPGVQYLGSGVVPSGGPKAFSARDLPDQVAAAHTEHGGSTFNPTRGNLVGEPAYAVSLYPERGIVLDRPPTTEDIAAFVKKNKTILADPRISVGTWFDEKTGEHFVDLTATVADRDLAIALGRSYNQRGIYNLLDLEEIRTGGSGTVPRRLPPSETRLPLVGQADEVAQRGLREQAREIAEGRGTDWWQREFGNDPKVMAQAERLEAGLERALQQTSDTRGLSSLDETGLKPFATPTTKFPEDVIPRPTPIPELRQVIEAGLERGYGNWYREFADDTARTVGDKRALEGLANFASYSAILGPRAAKKLMLSTMIAADAHKGFVGMDVPQIVDAVIGTYKRTVGTEKGLYYLPVSFQNVESIYRTGGQQIGQPKLSNFFNDFINGRLPWQADATPTNDVQMQRLEGYRSWGDTQTKLGSDDNTYRYGAAVTRRVAQELGVPAEDAQAAGWVVQQLSSLPTANVDFAEARRLNLADPAKAAHWKEVEPEWKTLAAGVRAGKVTPGQALEEIERLDLFDFHNPGSIQAINADPAIVKLQTEYDRLGLKDAPMPGGPRERPGTDVGAPTLRGGLAHTPASVRPWMSADLRTRAENPLNQRMLEQAPVVTAEGSSPMPGSAIRELRVPNRIVDLGNDQRGVALPTMNAERATNVATRLAETLGQPVMVRRATVAGEMPTHVQVTIDAANAPGLTRSIAQVRSAAEALGAEVHWSGQQAHILFDMSDAASAEQRVIDLYHAVQSQGINADALRLGGSRVERIEPGGAAARVAQTAGAEPASAVSWRSGADDQLAQRLADALSSGQPGAVPGRRAGDPVRPGRTAPPAELGTAEAAGSGVIPRLPGLRADAFNAAQGGVMGAVSEDLQAQQEGREADPAERLRRGVVGAGLATAGGRYARRGLPSGVQQAGSGAVPGGGGRKWVPDARYQGGGFWHTPSARVPAAMQDAQRVTTLAGADYRMSVRAREEAETFAARYPDDVEARQRLTGALAQEEHAQQTLDAAREHLQMVQTGDMTLGSGVVPEPSPNRGKRPTVEVLREQLETATQAFRRATEAGDERMAQFARERAVQIENDLGDALNTRRSLEPRIASDVGRQVNPLTLTEESADDLTDAMRPREAVRTSSDDLSGPVGIPTNMAGRQNAAIPFDPASAAAGGAAGAASEDEEGQQGDPLRTGAGMLMAGMLGRRFPDARAWYRRAAAKNAAEMAAKGITAPSKGELVRGTVATAGQSSLLGPATAAFNAASSLMQPIWAIPKEPTRAVMRAIGTGNPEAMKEPLVAMDGVMQGMGHVGEALWDVLRARGKYAPNVDAPNLSQRISDPIGRGLMQALEAPGRVWAGAPDAVFGTLSQYAVDARKAAQVATDAGHRGQKWEDWVDLYRQETERVRSTGSKQVSADVTNIIKAGDTAAERAAYRQPLGEIGKQARNIARLGNNGPVGQFVAPFFNSPWNIHLQAAERSPAGFLMNTQASKFDKHYDAVVGSAAVLGMVEMARRGNLTVNGSGPTNQNERQAWLDEGNRPYSTVIAGVAIPNRAFTGAEPLMNAVGETFDWIRYQKPTADSRALTNEAMTRIGRVIKQYPFSAGYGTLADLAEFGAPAAAADVMTRFTPGAATLRGIGTAGDTAERTVDRGKGVPMVDEAIQRWQQATGQRADLPVAQNILGEPKENPQPGVWAFFGRLGYPKEDPVISIFQDAQMLPSDPRDQITLDAEDGVKITLKPGERREWDAARGAVLRKAGAKLAANPSWVAMPLEGRQETLQELMDDAAEAADEHMKQVIGGREINRRVRAEPPVPAGRR